MKSNQFKLLILLQIVTLFLVGMSFFYSKDTDISGKRAMGQPLKAISSGTCNDIEIKEETISYNNNQFIYGDKDAPNELVIFSRYNCYYCKQFYQELFSYLQANYVNQGKLKIIFFMSANPMDEMEMLMAKATEVGRKKNIYAEMQKTFYSDEFQKDSVSITNLLIQEGITPELLADKLSNNVIKENIYSQLKEGERLKVTGTPTFFLNGYRMVGYNDKNNFLAYLKAYLKT